ncbi:MAG: hypothetical protein JWO62_441 [Acidimicrobiaceae bacterium]|nr:hypothetical protein [Acidimicrobiaceae bacterium]
MIGARNRKGKQGHAMSGLSEDLREAVEKARTEVGEVVETLGQKAEASARAHRVENSRERLRGSKKRATAKLEELGQRAGALPGQARPVVTSSTKHARSITTKSAASARRRPVPVLIAAAATLGLVLFRRFGFAGHRVR